MPEALRRYGVTDSLFACITWDDVELDATSLVKVHHPDAPNYQWHETFNFDWGLQHIDSLIEKKMLLQIFVHRKAHNVNELVGHVPINLLTIATGPVSHALSILSPKAESEATFSSLDRGTGDERSKPIRNPHTVVSYHPKPGGKSETVGKMTISIRMSQICSLIVQPVDVG